MVHGQNLIKNRVFMLPDITFDINDSKPTFMNHFPEVAITSNTQSDSDRECVTPHTLIDYAHSIINIIILIKRKNKIDNFF